MFESHHEPLLSRWGFVRRILKFLALGAAIDVGFAILGAIGFHFVTGLVGLDAFVETVLVMTGNGPRHALHSAAADLYVSVLALTGGTVYVIVAGLVLTPGFHRLLHTFHHRAPRNDSRIAGESPSAVNSR